MYRQPVTKQEKYEDGHFRMFSGFVLALERQAEFIAAETSAAFYKTKPSSSTAEVKPMATNVRAKLSVLDLNLDSMKLPPF